MNNLIVNIIDYLSQKSFGHSLIAFLVFVIFLKVITKLIDDIFDKSFKKSKLSPDSVVCLKMVIAGFAILFPTLMVYFFLRKLIFVWVLCSIAGIIGGGLGLIPFSFVKKKRK